MERIAIAVAMTRGGLTGKGNALPWDLPAERVHFKRLTWGYPVIMGRRTYESVGAPLEGRNNIVLSGGRAIADGSLSPFELRCSHGPAPLKRDGGRTDINESRAARYGAKLPPTTSRQLEIVSTVQDALAVARRVEGVKEEKVWVIGGGSVYEQFLPLADELHISWIEGDYEGDVYFPTVDWDRWRSVSKEKRVGFEYEVFARKA